MSNKFQQNIRDAMVDSLFMSLLKLKHNGLSIDNSEYFVFKSANDPIIPIPCQRWLDPGIIVLLYDDSGIEPFEVQM